MKKFSASGLALVCALMAPAMALAQNTNTNTNTNGGLLDSILGGGAIALIGGLVILFLVFQFLFRGGD